MLLYPDCFFMLIISFIFISGSQIVQVERLVKIAEVCVVGIAKITLLAIQEVDIVTIRVLQDFWEITAI